MNAYKDSEDERARPDLRNSSGNSWLGFYAIVAAVGAFFAICFSGYSAAEAVTNYGIIFPTKVADGVWYVCQGYNSSISHNGGDRYGLDLIPSKAAVGSTGCSYSTAANNRAVYTPADGWIAWKSESLGLVCINLRDGNTALNVSLKIGHLRTKAATTSAPAQWRSVAVGGKVTEGKVLGYVAQANDVGNGGVAHLHIGAYKGTGCASGNSIPFASAQGTALTGLNCANGSTKSFNLTSSGAANQHKGVCIGGPFDGPD